jgi:hypothetical protein
LRDIERISLALCILKSQLAKPAIVPAAIRVDDGPVIAVGYPLDGSIQHGVHQGGIWTRADGPADNWT